MTRDRIPRLALLSVILCLLVFGPEGRGTAGGAQTAASFASRIAEMSEPGGYFDTDNLISNERSYLEVLPELRREGVRGGAYIGVGPDTNFTYIAEIRPAIAFIIDIRRDNLLLHLLFKALFELSTTRGEYLALLFGRPPPREGRTPAADRIVAHFGRITPTAASSAAARRRVDGALGRSGVPLSPDDRLTIARFHQRFIDEGPALRFNTLGRAPQSSYPTYGELILATDGEGRQGNYLASEDAFRFVKSLQARDRIVPVVGDLSGPTAMTAIGRLLAAERLALSAFYASNVEFYLYGQGTFPRFVDNLRHIPRSDRSVVIRSVFGRSWSPGSFGASTSQIHPIGDLLDGFSGGRFRSYGQLVAVR